jgi:hypothetical protein
MMETLSIRGFFFSGAKVAQKLAQRWGSVVEHWRNPLYRGAPLRHPKHRAVVLFREEEDPSTLKAWYSLERFDPQRNLRAWC